jgi:hypothetical protein
MIAESMTFSKSIDLYLNESKELSNASTKMVCNLTLKDMLSESGLLKELLMEQTTLYELLENSTNNIIQHSHQEILSSPASNSIQNLLTKFDSRLNVGLVEKLKDLNGNS